MLKQDRRAGSSTGESRETHADQRHGSDGDETTILCIKPPEPHVHWKTAAERFSNLLDADFTDIIIRVQDDSGNSQFAAHKMLLAAAWPLLREDLKVVKGFPSVELRQVSLSWATDAESDVEEEKKALKFVRAPSKETHSSTPADKVDGVLDLSHKKWGTWRTLHALLRHLYCRPVWVHELELPLLRDAAADLSCSEFERSCVDAERRAATQRKRWWKTAAPGAPIPRLPSSSGQGHGAPNLRGDSGVSTAVSSSDSHAQVASTSQPAGSMENDASKMSEPFAAPPVKIPSRILNEFSSKPDSWNRSQASGGDAVGTDFHSKNQSSSQPNDSDGFGVRRVLSDLKRNIVESSRIISDAKFQDVYELVPGEKGILGEGINGPVRMARHRQTGKEVAVKRLSCVNLSEQRRQMLLSEVRIFLQVSHRNIVQLQEVYESAADSLGDRAVVLIMELCTGQELFVRLADRKWYSEYDAAHVTQQMLDAVSYLHSQNICHRDLKLENWLYENNSSNANLKLCDFGFGQIVEPSVQLTATLGSLYYVAPEVLEGSYGLPCDIWSLGVIVHMLLTGVPPFDGKTDGEVIAKVRQGRFNKSGKRWDRISETAKHFVQSLLRKDPSERLSAAEAMHHAWLKMDSYVIGSCPDPELPIDQNVVLEMRKFAQSNAITRAALGMLSSKGTSTFLGAEEDVLQMEKQFKLLDDKGTGKIAMGDFIQVLRDCMQVSSSEAKEVFESIASKLQTEDMPQNSNRKTAEDKQTQGKDNRAVSSQAESQPRKQPRSNTRTVNWGEFLAATKVRRMAINAATIREAFRVFEDQGKKFTTIEDLHGLLGVDIEAERLREIMAKCDADGDGLIDYVDFAHVFSQEMAQQVESTRRDESKQRNKEDEIAEGAAHKEAVPASNNGGGDGGADASLPDSSFKTSPEAITFNPPLRGATPDPPVDVEEHHSDSTTSSPQYDGKAAPQKVSLISTGADEAASPAPVSAALLDMDFAAAASPRSEMAEPRSDDEKVDQDEECHESDEEEQLVKISQDEERGGGQRNKSNVEGQRDRPKPPKQSDNARFGSVSLSLAGSSEIDDLPVGVNRVQSLPSDSYEVKQFSGFHFRVLRPFYSNQPVSNVVMGLIRGTSLYARQSVAAKMATIIHTASGWFFIMPNPKYHSALTNGRELLSRDDGGFRFVAWWIHPRFVPQLRLWFERLTYEGMDQEKQDQRREHARVHEKKQDQREQRDQRDQREKGGANNPTKDNSGNITVSKVLGSLFDTVTGRKGKEIQSTAHSESDCQTALSQPSQAILRGISEDTSSTNTELSPVYVPPTREHSAGSGSKSIESTVSTMTVMDSAKEPKEPEISDEQPLPDQVSLEEREDCVKNVAKKGQKGEKERENKDLRCVPAANQMGKDIPLPESMGMGNPGDMRFSDVPKPENYLHTYRDLHRPEHVAMLEQLKEGLHRFLRSIFDESRLKNAQISSGFHYPVRTQYSTLHMQVRVQSGSVCGSDGRGVELDALMETLGKDPHVFARDDDTIKYKVTENIKMSLLAAANDFKQTFEYAAQYSTGIEPVRQVAPLSYELGLGGMPTIKDEEEKEEPEIEPSGSDPNIKNEVGEYSRLPSKPTEYEQTADYLINLQPVVNGPLDVLLRKQREECKRIFGPDPTLLYPFHVAVTGFFDATQKQLNHVLRVLKELVESTKEHGEIQVSLNEILTTDTGYVIVDVKGPSVATISQTLSTRCAKVDVKLRVKAVNHISLASDRPDPETRLKIQELFAPVAHHEGAFDIVVSRLLQRRSFEEYEQYGPHDFLEIARIALSKNALS